MKKIAVIGQGYVGLPLAVAFSKHFRVVGYDINEKRVEELEQGKDSTKEVEEEKLKTVLSEYKTSKGAKGYLPSADLQNLAQANIYIITVPTPIDEFNAPNLKPLKEASKTRSEEHTSELQSRENLVCRLLLEKK